MFTATLIATLAAIDDTAARNAAIMLEVSSNQGGSMDKLLALASAVSDARVKLAEDRARAAAEAPVTLSKEGTHFLVKLGKGWPKALTLSEMDALVKLAAEGTIAKGYEAHKATPSLRAYEALTPAQRKARSEARKLAK